MTREELTSILEGYELAIKAIRTWHGMCHDTTEEKAMWALYQHSPEMKSINAKRMLVEAKLRGARGDV